MPQWRPFGHGAQRFRPISKWIWLGKQPDDIKPMPSIGKGVEEIRVWDDAGTFRVVYTARWVDAVVVLQAFQKKTQVTSKRDIEIAKLRFVQPMGGE